MKLLIDTQTLIWWLLDDAKLSSSVRALLAQPENAIGYRFPRTNPDRFRRWKFSVAILTPLRKWLPWSR